MVDSVMRRRVEDELYHRWKPAHALGVQPKLVYQTKAEHRNHHQGVETKEWQWHPKEILKDALTNTLSQRGTKVVMFAIVMRYMTRPQYSNLVVQTVMPIVNKIVQEKEQ